MSSIRDRVAVASWQTRLTTGLSEPAYGLAALRVAVVGILLLSPELSLAPTLARSPELLVATPEGLGWLREVRIAPALVDAARVLAFSAGATALLGYWARASCGVLLLAATFLLSFSQRVGAPLHDVHLLWLLAVLAGSRCGDVWALDASGEPTPAPSPTYGVPLCAARLLLGIVYFFPGFHKLVHVGPAWASASNLTAILHHKWFQYGEVPPFRLDQHPTLLVAGGAFVLAFELSFIALAQLRRTRVPALGAGLLFHAVSQLGFFISFPALWVCYVVLVPWPASFRSQPADASKATARASGWPLVSLSVAALLVVGSAQAGVRAQTAAYPFACYPTFAEYFPPVSPDILVEVVRADGSARRFERDVARPRTQQEWGQVYWLMGAYRAVATDEQLRRFARSRARSDAERAALASARSLRFWIALYSTAPRDWSKPPTSLRWLREVPAQPTS